MSKRIGALDVLKSLVISVLACHHYQWLLRGDYRFRLNLYDGAFYVGPLVELFFLLSGFLALRYKKQIEQVRKTWKKVQAEPVVGSQNQKKK